MSVDENIKSAAEYISGQYCIDINIHQLTLTLIFEQILQSYWNSKMSKQGLFKNYK